MFLELYMSSDFHVSTSNLHNKVANICELSLLLWLQRIT